MTLGKSHWFVITSTGYSTVGHGEGGQWGVVTYKNLKIDTESRKRGHKSAWKVKDRTKAFKEKEKLKWTKEGRLRLLRA